MKQIYCLLIGLLAFCVSCQDDEENLEDSLIGVWYDKYSTVAPESGFVLKANHTGTTFYKTSSWKFHWRLDGTTLTVEHDDPQNKSLDESANVSKTYQGILWGSTTYVSDPNNCFTSSGGGTGGGTTTGKAPSSLSSKTLKLYKDDDSYWMGIYHKSNTSCTVDLYNGAMVSSTYPPSYSYTASGSKATYTLNFTTQTYIPYYGTYTYAQFQEKITLQFSSSTKGTYSGTQTNMNGGSKSISGNFQIQ